MGPWVSRCIVCGIGGAQVKHGPCVACGAAKEMVCYDELDLGVTLYEMGKELLDLMEKNEAKEPVN